MLVLATALAGCGASGAHTVRAPGSGTAPGTSAAPRQTTSPVGTGTTTGAGGAVGHVHAPRLVDWGATEGAWLANHHPDPLATASGGYWPRYPNGLDNYASVRFVNGRAERYTINFYPAQNLSGMTSWVRDELPPDSTLSRTVVRPPAAGRPGCEELVFSSAVLSARLHSSVLARAFGAGPLVDPSAFVAVRLSPISPSAASGPGTSLPPC